jgi:O-antigen ligase
MYLRGFAVIGLMGKTQTARKPPATSVDWRGALTQWAFALALAVVLARCTMLEALRESFAITPGTKPYPLGPGPASSLALDLLCCVPALLVLARRAVDRNYVLRWSWSQVLLLPLIGWMALSIRWADDKFATMVSTANFVGAMALLWAAGQLVRSWLRLRTVAAIAFGLLLLSLAYGFYYKFSEMPEMITTFRANEAQMLKDRGDAPQSFAARQFEKKILSEEVIGFNASANSFAAMVVLLMTIGLGVAFQRLADRDNVGWTIALAISAPLAVWLLVYTKTKAALVTPVITIALLAAIWTWRRTLAEHSRRWFWIGVAAVLAVMAAVVGHGMHRHHLPTDSLNFRWRYWVATWRVFRRHPIRGVGWDNFYLYYLRDRLYSASEEIRDPHNFIIRFFVDLGLIGGVLMLAWLGRLWWELTRPVIPAPAPAVATAAIRPQRAIIWLVCTGAAAMLINVFAALDLSQQASYLVMELLKRIMYLGALTIGSVVVALKSVEQPQIDERPAPWILYGILVGLGVFLIHNLIEFSLFEPGLLCLFALLAGSALGVRQPSVAGRRRRTAVAIGVLAVATVLWLAAVIGLYAPTALAESDAHRGDAALRQNQLTAAFGDFSSAWLAMKINADHAFRAAQALHYEAAAALHSGGSRISTVPALALQIQAYYDIAIERNPAAVGPYLWRASFAMMMHDGEQATHDFRKALELNPNEVSIRLEFARALATLGKPADAREQFRLALWYNDQLDPAEPKRLSPEQIDAINSEIAALPGKP